MIFALFTSHSSKYVSTSKFGKTLTNPSDMLSFGVGSFIGGLIEKETKGITKPLEGSKRSRPINSR